MSSPLLYTLGQSCPISFVYSHDVQHCKIFLPNKMLVKTNARGNIVTKTEVETGKGEKSKTQSSLLHLSRCQYKY